MSQSTRILQTNEKRTSKSLHMDRTRIASVSQAKMYAIMAENKTIRQVTNVAPISLLSESGADVLSLWSVLFMQSFLLSVCLLIPLSLYFGLVRWIPAEVFDERVEIIFMVASRIVGQLLFAAVIISLLFKLFDYQVLKKTLFEACLPIFIMVSSNNFLMAMGFMIWVWVERMATPLYLLSFYHLYYDSKKKLQQDPTIQINPFILDGTLPAVAKGTIFSVLSFITINLTIPIYFESSFATQLVIRLVLFNSVTCAVDYYQLYVLKDLSPDLIQQRMEAASLANAHGQFLGRVMICNVDTKNNSSEFLIMCFATSLAEILFRVTYNIRYHAFVKLINWYHRHSHRGWRRSFPALRIFSHVNRVYHEHIHPSSHKQTRTIAVASNTTQNVHNHNHANQQHANQQHADKDESQEIRHESPRSTTIRVREQDEYEDEYEHEYRQQMQQRQDTLQRHNDNEDIDKDIQKDKDIEQDTSDTAHQKSSHEPSSDSYIERDIFGNTINPKRPTVRPYELPSPLLEMRSKQIMDEIASDIRVSILVPFFLYLTHPFFAGSSVQTIDSMFDCVWQAGTQIVFEFFCDLVSLYVEIYYYGMPLDLSIREAWRMSSTLGLISCFSIFNLFNYITLSVMKYDYSVF